MSRYSIGKTVFDFCTTSECFNGMSFIGCFDIDLKGEFCVALDHYAETGENVLDELFALLDLPNTYCNEMWGKKRISEIESLLTNNGFWNVNHYLSDIQQERIRLKINECRAYEEYKQSYPGKRAEACAYTARKDIRKKIFDRDGRKCLKCGSVKNLTLDHIIPVSKGGENKMDNMQVLCKSCNSKKGDKIEVV